MASIYKKTIDQTVQDGLDTSVILEPNEYYQEPFEFGSDWEEIKLGMFFSYVTLVDPNTRLPDGTYNSGGGAADGFSYFGAIEDQDPKFLPLESGGGSYVGQRFSKQVSVTATSGINLNMIHDADGENTIITTEGPVELDKSSSSVNYDVYSPFSKASDTTGFAAYWGVNLKVNDLGLPTQYVTVENYIRTMQGNWTQHAITDISMGNLKALMNGADYMIRTQDVQFNDGVSATTLPSAFFFYNAFQDSRTRLHAIAVKKIL